MPAFAGRRKNLWDFAVRRPVNVDQLCGAVAMLVIMVIMVNINGFG
jgi:hypothetical protein